MKPVDNDNLNDFQLVEHVNLARRETDDFQHIWLLTVNTAICEKISTERSTNKTKVKDKDNNCAIFLKSKHSWDATSHRTCDMQLDWDDDDSARSPDETINHQTNLKLSRQLNLFRSEKSTGCEEEKKENGKWILKFMRNVIENLRLVMFFSSFNVRL